MSIYPQHTITKPPYATAANNGKLTLAVDGGQLYPISGGGKLNAFAAWFWVSLVNKAKAAGITLTYTGTYRTYEQQVALFLSRYEPVSYAAYLITPSSRRRIWVDGKGNKYWRKKLINGRYPASAASPGTSNHGWAYSIDAAQDGFGVAAKPLSASTLAWLKTNAPAHGFYWETDAEPWHLTYCFGLGVPK